MAIEKPKQKIYNAQPCLYEIISIYNHIIHTKVEHRNSREPRKHTAHNGNAGKEVFEG